MASATTAGGWAAMSALDTNVFYSATQRFCYKNAMQGWSQLSHVALGVKDVSTSVAFYSDVFGFQEAEQLDDGGRRLGHGAGHHVLELRHGSGLLHFGLEIRDTGLPELYEQLLEAAASPIPQLDSEGTLVALRLRDPDGNVVELHGPIDRSGERATDGGTRPQRADHITFGSPQVGAMVAFYRDVLGLRVSDRMAGDDFVWMRGGRHHHDVAVVRSLQPTLDHFSFEVCSWANLRNWCDRFAAFGVPLVWGPGRHGPGNNLFAFVDDPDGRRIELSCEMEVFWDDHVSYPRETRVWARGGSVGNLWGPLPAWRETVMTSA